MFARRESLRYRITKMIDQAQNAAEGQPEGSIEEGLWRDLEGALWDALEAAKNLPDTRPPGPTKVTAGKGE